MFSALGLFKEIGLRPNIESFLRIKFLQKNETGTELMGHLIKGSLIRGHLVKGHVINTNFFIVALIKWPKKATEQNLR